VSEVIVVIDPDDAAGPPRHNGELVFDAPWQGRAFGMCVALLEREGRGWDAFRPYLVEALAADPGGPYYDAFVVALDRFVADVV
jgi:hypothetical protein